MIRSLKQITTLAFAYSILLSGIVSHVWAQATTAALSGTVADSSGAAIPDATVQVRNTGTGAARNLSTDAQGRYNAPDLPIGAYEVQGAKTGFQTVVRSGISLNIGSSLVVDLALPVGQSQQTVTVEGAIAQVETTTSTVSNLVEQKQMRELPLNGRNFQQLILLAPGVQVAQTSTTSFYGKGDTYSVAGGRPEGQAYLLDGTDVTNFFNRGTGSGSLGTSLGMDAIAEFQTLTNTYSAQFGGNGAVVNAVSKSGTNAFHGGGFWFLRNAKFDARDFFELDKPAPFKRNQYGGTFQGPIKKDKAFFFFNYEGLHLDKTVTFNANVPDADAHNGIINGVNVGFASPLIRNIMNIYPNPGRNCGGICQVATQGVENGLEHYLLGRVDYTISEKDTLFVRYAFDKARFTNPFPNRGAGRIPGWSDEEPTKNQYITVEDKHVFSPTLVNAFRVGFVRTISSANTTTGFPELNFHPNVTGQNGNITINGLDSLGPTALAPYILLQNKASIANDMYLTKGSHSIKFGIYLNRIQTYEDQPFSGAGNFGFASLTAFLQGIPNRFAGAFPPPTGADAYRAFREMQIMPYFNDDWKVNSRLTLNLGLRLDYNTNPHSIMKNLMVITNPPFNSVGGNISTDFTLVDKVWRNNPQKNNWGPRVGFAYELTSDHKTSLRGGFGDFHNVIAPRTYTSGYVTGPPFFSVIVVPNPAIPVIPFPNPFAANVTKPVVANGQTVDYNMAQTPAIYQWNLNLQRELWGGTVLTVGYVGSRGIHLLTQSDQNPARPIVGADGVTRYGNPLTGSINPRWSPNFATINALQPNGRSRYNSLTVNAVRRFSKNWQAQAAYTWSHSLDDGSGSSGLETGGGPRSNSYNFAADYGSSTFDIRHSLRVNSVVALPFKGTFAGHQLIEGWQVSGIVSATSAPPLLITTGFDRALLGASATGNQRPSLKPGFTADSIRQKGNRLQWFNPNAFELQPEGTPGNLGRNTIRGVPFFVADAALLKDIKIKEGMSAQFRAEFFNILNHTNFGTPTLAVFQATGRAADGTQLTRVNPNAGLITSTNAGQTSRQIQLGVRFNF